MKKFLTTVFLSLLLFLSACSSEPQYNSEYASAPTVVESTPPPKVRARTVASPPPEYAYSEIMAVPDLETPAGSPEPEDTETTRARVQEEPSISVDEISRQLSWASFGYSVPEEANIDDEVEIEMLVNPLLSEVELGSQLRDGQHTTGRVQISRVIEAKLTSRDFEIQNITPERQVVFRDRNTKWLWSLKPLSPGPNKKIKITVNAIVTVDGERTERYIETYTDTIRVDITVKQRLSAWISSNWEWAWSALLIPLAGWVWSRRRPSKPEES